MPKTPPRGVRQSSEDRDLSSIRERRLASQSDRVLGALDDHDTAPIDLIDREDSSHNDELRAIQREYERNPAYRALWNMIRRQRRESNRTIGVVADAASKVHHDLVGIKDVADKLQDIADWKREVDVILRIMKWILGVVFVAAIGSVIVIATKIYTWGVNSGELEIRIQHLERAIERRNQRDYNFQGNINPSSTRNQ